MASGSSHSVFRLAAVGCGKVFRHHLSAAAECSSLRLVAVCDRREDRAAAVAQTESVQAYGRIESLLKHQQPDILAVLTPSGDHVETALKAVGKVRALVIEKPMALHTHDADRLIHACREAGTRLFVVKPLRFSPPVQALRCALEQGRFGRLVSGSVRAYFKRGADYYRRDAWRGTLEMDGGVMANQAIHYIDLLQWMLGPVAAVQAYEARRLADTEAPDTGSAVLRFADGALGTVEATTATRPFAMGGALTLLGENGSVEIEGFAAERLKTWNFTRTQPEDDGLFDRLRRDAETSPGGHAAFYRHVVECLETGCETMLSGEEGRKSVALIEAMARSSATGREVRLDEAAETLKRTIRREPAG